MKNYFFFTFNELFAYENVQKLPWNSFQEICQKDWLSNIKFFSFITFWPIEFWENYKPNKIKDEKVFLLLLITFLYRKILAENVLKKYWPRTFPGSLGSWVILYSSYIKLYITQRGKIRYRWRRSRGWYTYM